MGRFWGWLAAFFVAAVLAIGWLLDKLFGKVVANAVYGYIVQTIGLTEAEIVAAVAGHASALAVGSLLLIIAYVLGYQRGKAAAPAVSAAEADPPLIDAKRRAAKDLIGRLMNEGQALLASRRQGTEQEFASRVQSWAEGAKAEIEASLGPGEATLFMSNHGLTLYSPGGGNAKQRVFMDGRLRRLTSLLERVDTMAL
jgi:hypothetical protein